MSRGLGPPGESSETGGATGHSLTLSNVTAVTNRPVIINAQMLGNGSFQGTLAGIAGRKYAVDVTASLPGAWTTLTNFGTFSGEATFTDPATGGSPRFYRGRLMP